MSSGYHIRNRDGERQRVAVSAFQGGSRKKPAFTVTCHAKAMIHGTMGGGSGKRASLLVYELKFLSRRGGTRIKEADVLFEFKKASETSLAPEVAVRAHFLTALVQTAHSAHPKTCGTSLFPILRFQGFPTSRALMPTEGVARRAASQTTQFRPAHIELD